jgi:hypothetical protein
VHRRREPFWARKPPTSALIGVAALALSEWLIETQAIAVLNSYRALRARACLDRYGSSEAASFALDPSDLNSDSGPPTTRLMMLRRGNGDREEPFCVSAEQVDFTANHMTGGQIHLLH